MEDKVVITINLLKHLIVSEEELVHNLKTDRSVQLELWERWMSKLQS